MHDILTELEERLTGAIQHLSERYAGLQAGTASAGLVENISVHAYGAHQPIKSLANIATPDSRTVSIEVWDASVCADVEKAITASGLGLTPQSDGRRILLSIPPVTAERRADLQKIISTIAEESRISVRRARADTRSTAQRRAKDDTDDLTEDQLGALNKRIDESVAVANDRIAQMARTKASDLATL